MAEIRHSRIEINGVAAPIAEAGPSEAAEAAVCLHSVPGSGRDFQWLLPETGNVMRSIAVDLPGFGQSRQAPRLSLFDRGLSTMACAGDR